MTILRFDGADDGRDLEVDLRDYRLAAVLAWLWPGAGHFYQRRFAKGFLFMICVLGTFFMGLRIGSGRVVYASFGPEDFRWQYFCQAFVGLPAFPAVVQGTFAGRGGDPLWVLCERYPAGTVIDGQSLEYRRIPSANAGKVPGALKDGFMAPPAGRVYPERNDVLGMWHVELGNWFEIGTFYTVIAGLLNLLAIYDAFAGPALMVRAAPVFPD